MKPIIQGAKITVTIEVSYAESSWDRKTLARTEVSDTYVGTIDHLPNEVSKVVDETHRRSDSILEKSIKIYNLEQERKLLIEAPK